MRRLRLGEVFGSEEFRVARPGAHYCKARALPGVGRHAHEEAHFVLVIEGGYLTGASGGDDVQGSRTLVYNPPDTEHADRFGVDGGRFASLHMPAAALTDAESRFPAEATCLRDPALVARFIGGALAIERDPAACEAVAVGMIAGLAPPDDQLAADPGWLGAAVDMMTAEDGPMSVAEVARAAGVHPVHFARVFRRRFGIGPRAYARKMRVRRACDLLLKTRLSLADIATRCGFADQPHFSREFKAVVGARPGDVRAARF